MLHLRESDIRWGRGRGGGSANIAQLCAHAQKQTDRRTDRQTHTHTHTSAYERTCTLSLSIFHTLSLSLSCPSPYGVGNVEEAFHGRGINQCNLAERKDVGCDPVHVNALWLDKQKQVRLLNAMSWHQQKRNGPPTHDINCVPSIFELALHSLHSMHTISPSEGWRWRRR